MRKKDVLVYSTVSFDAEDVGRIDFDNFVGFKTMLQVDKKTLNVHVSSYTLSLGHHRLFANYPN